jgi:heavy metal sensor kinase
MSLRLRLTLTYTLLTALSLGFLSLTLYTVMRRSLEAEMDRRLEVRSRQVELTIWPGTISLTADDLSSATLNLAPLARLNAPNVYVQVLGRDGNVIAASENLQGSELPVTPSSLQQALAGERVLDEVRIEEDHTIRTLSVPIPVERNIVGVLQVGQSRLPLEETMAGLRTLLQLMGAGALLLSTAVGWLVAYHGLRPLSLISARAATITAHRDFSKRLDYRGQPDEVGQLANAIDELLATVDDTLRTHREFVADTSHELRNPLLAIRTNLDLLDRLPDAESRAECLQETRQQAERMSRLVTDLLLLAQVEAGRVVERRPVQLTSLVERVTHEAQQRADGREITLSPLEPVQLVGDEERLAQVVRNLVDNAIRHTEPGARIDIALKREDGWARLDVSDTGAGIPAEHLDHVFERFYRVGRHPDHDSGSGLGLAIVKHLTEAHGGRVSVDSVVGSGTRFTVRLPVQPTS